MISMSDDIDKKATAQVKKLIKESIERLNELVVTINNLRTDLKSDDKAKQANGVLMTHLITDSIKNGVEAQKKHIKDQLSG